MSDRPRLWLDCETSSLADDRRAWEVAAILRPAGGSRLDDVEFSWFVDIEDLDLPQFGDPVSLNIGGFWARHPQAALVPLTGQLTDVTFDGRVPPPAPVFSEREVLEQVAELTAARAVVHGSNPAFDIMTLGPRMSVYGIKPGWHYHPEDVPSTARGWLLGRGHIDPPSKSDQISLACGIDPTGYGRHEALGDCRWLRDLSDLIELPGPPSRRGWDPSFPQHAVIRAAIAWRVSRGAFIADDPERRGTPGDLALIEAVDALPHIGEATDV